MRYLLAFVVCVLMSLPAVAQEKDIRSVISGQINSFLKDDFVTAFSFAAPNIKQIFQTPERFGMMVSKGYPMVHRPAEVSFQDLSKEDETFVQDVLIRDTLGQYYVARYTMVENAGVWQISGVSILPSVGLGA